MLFCCFFSDLTLLYSIWPCNILQNRIFSTGSNFMHPPLCGGGDLCLWLEIFLIVTTLEGKGHYWHPSRLKPGMLLHILKCTEQPPTTKNDLFQDFNSAEVEKTCPRDSCGFLKFICF